MSSILAHLGAIGLYPGTNVLNWAQFCSTVLNCTKMGSIVLNCTQLGSNVLNCAQLCSTVLNCTQLCSTGLNCAQLASIVLNCSQLSSNIALLGISENMKNMNMKMKMNKSLFLKCIALRVLKNFINHLYCKSSSWYGSSNCALSKIKWKIMAIISCIKINWKRKVFFISKLFS